MNLPKCLERFRHLIHEVSDERHYGNGYWVYLISGWLDMDGEVHCIHEDTPQECAEAMKSVIPCRRSGCCDKINNPGVQQ